MSHNRWFSIILMVAILAGMLGLAGVSRGSALSTAVTPGRMGLEVQISSPVPTDTADRQKPVAAYNSNRHEHLVVWQNKWPGSYDIYGQRVDANGKKIGLSFSISSGPGNRIQPAVAYSKTSDLYFVVFMHDVSAANDGSRYNIEAQRVRWDGAKLGDPIIIETSPTASFWSPKIAANGSYDDFGIVWGVMDIASGLASAIGLKAYTAAGGYLYGTILDTNGNPTNPDLVWNPVNKQFLVVWNRFNPTWKNVVIGDLRNQDYNRVLPGIIIIFDSSTNHALFPHVTYSSGYYGVTFEYEASPTDHDIYLALISYDTLLIFPIPVETSVENETSPKISGNPSSSGLEFMILFQRAGVNGATVWLHPVTNYMASTNLAVCNYTFWNCTMPAITKGGAGYLMMYTLDSIGDPGIMQHVFGRMFWQFTVNLPAVRK